MTDFTNPLDDQKERVRRFWDAASCREEAYALGDTPRARYQAHAHSRYSLEPACTVGLA